MEQLASSRDTFQQYVKPSQNTLSATNEESELAFLKGLRSGKVTIQTDESIDAGNIVIAD